MKTTHVLPNAYTVAEFCEAYRISRTKLYDLWKLGSGPISYSVGKRRFIATSEAEAWQRNCH